MADEFRAAFEALRDIAEARIAANPAIKRAVDAVLAVKGEHENLRATVHRLDGPGPGTRT